jgi:hypothetical protein
MTRLLTMVNGRPDAAGPGAVVLLAAGRPAQFCWRDPEVASSAPARSPAILIRIGDGGRLAKLLDSLLLPFARARVERLLARRGSTGSRAAVYAVAPDCEKPTWVYRLGSPASAYADSHLLPRSGGMRALRAAVRWWTGCDSAVAGLLVIGGR